MTDIEIGRACSTYEGEERGIKPLLWKSEGKKLFGRPRRR